MGRRSNAVRKTETDIRRPGIDQHNDLTWRFIDRRFDDSEVTPGPAICARCHSYLETDHWLYGEKRYRELKEMPDTLVLLCPGCTRVERRIYEGEIIIHHDWEAVAKQDVMNLVHNEEARARATNPTARVALMEDRGDDLYILTTSEFLAKRIGLELQKAYKGTLKLYNLPRERFIRVRWSREAA